MNKVMVAKVKGWGLLFDNGSELMSDHRQSCCEVHDLSFSDLTLEDFEGLEFDLSDDNFFDRIDGYGIILKPLNGHPVSVPGYGRNNGYYSSQLDLILRRHDGIIKRYDISDCQVIEGY